MIEVKNLSKAFGNKTAVDRISFTVQRGEVLGFLGPNGAGKTTTMRMITGFIPPTGGSVSIGGLDVASKPVQTREMLGYLPENAPVYPDMTVTGFLSFCAEARGYRKGAKSERVARAIEHCFLTAVINQPIATLSKGYKQRVCFAQSILHDPPYLILDEPTDGLDPNQKHEVREMIRRMSAKKAILLSTHILDEVDAVCTRALIIADGRLIADDSPAGLRSRSSTYGTITVVLKKKENYDPARKFESLAEVKSVQVVKQTASETTLRLIPARKQPATASGIIAALENENDLVSFFVDQGRLDDVFRSLTCTTDGKPEVGRINETPG